MRSAALLVLAVLALSACSALTADPLDLGPANTCAATSDCGPSAACVQGRCVATEYDLAGLRVEVRPRADGTSGARRPYVFDLSSDEDLVSHGGGAPLVARRELRMPAPVAIRGGLVRVDPATPLGAECTKITDRSIPARVTFYQSPPLAGLPADPIDASTGDDNHLDVDLVAGTYDVYVVPLPVEGCNGGLPFPPMYLPGRAIGEDATTLLLDLPPVGRLKATFNGFGSVIPSGWKVDLVEPSRGLPVSANDVFSKLDPPADGYLATAQVNWPAGAIPIVRLTPSDDIAQPTQPTGYWSVITLSGGDQQNPEVTISVDKLFAQPIKVTMNVLGSDEFSRVPATISVQSVKLDGADTNDAALSVAGRETDANGVFQAFLPPGEYALRATPIDNNLAITDTSATIAQSASCFCGQPFVLVPKLELSGRATTPDGRALTHAKVSVSPTQGEARTYWQSRHELAPHTSRAAGAETGSTGAFSLRIDPGTSDFVIQPDPSSGFPWLVRPRVDASEDERLGTIALSSPIIFTGVVTDADGNPVPNADINAWFPIRDAKGALFGTVIKVGTASTDDTGAFTLILPASI